MTGEVYPDDNLKYLSYLILSVEYPIYSNLRKLFDYIIFDQAVSFIAIDGIYPSGKSLNRLVKQSQLDYL